MHPVTDSCYLRKKNQIEADPGSSVPVIVGKLSFWSPIQLGERAEIHKIANCYNTSNMAQVGRRLSWSEAFKVGCQHFMVSCHTALVYRSAGCHTAQEHCTVGCYTPGWGCHTAWWADILSNDLPTSWIKLPRTRIPGVRFIIRCLATSAFMKAGHEVRSKICTFNPNRTPYAEVQSDSHILIISRNSTFTKQHSKSNTKLKYE